MRLLYDIFYLVNCQLLFIQLKKKQKKCAAISLFYCFFYFLILQISLPGVAGMDDGLNVKERIYYVSLKLRTIVLVS